MAIKIKFLGKEGNGFGIRSRYNVRCAQGAKHIATETGKKGTVYVLE